MTRTPKPPPRKPAIEHIRNRLRCAQRRERRHRGPWAGDPGGRHAELHSLARDDVDSLTIQLQAMVCNEPPPRKAKVRGLPIYSPEGQPEAPSVVCIPGQNRLPVGCAAKKPVAGPAKPAQQKKGVVRDLPPVDCALPPRYAAGGVTAMQTRPAG
jgi:hypothetical protein